MKGGGEAINLIILNSPLLEELIICCVNFTSDVEIRGGADLMLKRLDISGHGSVKSIRISAPNLTSFGGDVEPPEKLLLEYVPKLAEADLRFAGRKRNAGKNLASVLSCLSSQLQILSLSLYPKVFWDKGFPQMPKLKKLVVKANSLRHVTALLWASPLLQEFILVFQDLGSSTFTEDGRNGERSPHQHLKVFELAGFLEGAGGQVKLVDYILDNCVALLKIIVGCGQGAKSTPLHIAEAGKDYAKLQLPGRVPQHIQLQIL